jgi:hypothetical protein
MEGLIYEKTRCFPRIIIISSKQSKVRTCEVANFYHHPASKNWKKEIRLVLPEVIDR